MKCQQCGFDFPEPNIDESHDVPLYLFEGITRNERKNQADKFGRHWLCRPCHIAYESMLRKNLQQKAIIFAQEFFNGD